LFIHAINFTRQVLAAMTMIIKILPHHLQRNTPDSGRNATRKQARAGSTAAAALRVKGSLFVIGNSIESQADATERVPPKISVTRCGELGEKRK
jgi:ribosomal protein L16/L10AE